MIHVVVTILSKATNNTQKIRWVSGNHFSKSRLGLFTLGHSTMIRRGGPNEWEKLLQIYFNLSEPFTNDPINRNSQCSYICPS